MFCTRIRKYIGAYLAQLNGAQAICFAGGIGENSTEIREEVCLGLERLGIHIDIEKNRNIPEDSRGWVISKDDSPVKIYVIPIDEELLIARDAVRCIEHR